MSTLAWVFLERALTASTTLAADIQSHTTLDGGRRRHGSLLGRLRNGELAVPKWLPLVASAVALAGAIAVEKGLRISPRLLSR